MVTVRSFSDAGSLVHNVNRATFGDGSPLWESIGAALLPGEKIAGIFGGVQLDNHFGGVLVLSTDGIRFFERKSYKRLTAPYIAVPFQDIADLRQGLNLILKTVHRSKHSINAGGEDVIHEMILDLAGAEGAVAGRLYMPLAVSGIDLAIDGLVRVTLEDDGVRFSQESGSEIIVDYSKIDSITVGGPGLQVETRGGGMIGGGFGIAGFVVGAASAALYNRLTSRSDVSIETVLRIEGDGFEVDLFTPEVLPEDLDLEIAPTRTRIRSAARAAASSSTPMSQQLRELAELHASGVLSDDEFSAAKQKLIG